MKPTLWLLGLLAATTSTATAALVTIKSGSLTHTNRNCNGGIPPGQTAQTESFGTVQIARALNQLVAVPVLLKGTPNTLYSIRLFQLVNGVPVSCPTCPSAQTLKTNKDGIGYSTVQQTVSAGATGAFVVLNRANDCGNPDYYTIPVLPIT
ncbi:hypothetical protein N7490_009733 [Penicillium lividum]|nr:hypothetical protein N7490_009733 [Penicillium lividum]